MHREEPNGPFRKMIPTAMAKSRQVPMGTKIKYAFLAAVPMLITPGLIYMLAEGWFDFGGGEKDILLALPYFLWAFIFFVVALVLIIKNWSLQRWLLRSGFVSVVAMLVLGVVVYLNSWLGIS
jgi:hypothetical protein